MLHTLPTELIDYIIDFLSNDRPALYNCSLTCRTLLPRSRFHIFFHFTLRILSDSKFDSILGLPRSPRFPPMIEFVRSVEISEFARWTHLYPRKSWRALGLTPDHLCVTVACFRDLNPQTCILMNPHFVVSIKTLDLSSVTFGTILDLHLILCALPHLSDLLLRRCDWNDTSFCETFRPTDNPLFQSLKISPVKPSHLSLLASWLPGTQAGHALKDLHAHIPSHKFYAPLNQLIAAVYSTLEHLVLFKSPSKGMHDARSGRIDLSPCKNLSHLRFNNQLKLTMEEARFFEDQVIFPLKLRIVELAIQPNASETSALERIDQFFTRPQFRHLQSVILLYDQIDLTQISIGVWLGRIVRKMRRSLPRLRARGILRCGTTRMDFSGSQKAREVIDYLDG